MKKTIQKFFFVFEVNPCEFVGLNCVYQERILAIGTQCLRKQIRDFAYH